MERPEELQFHSFVISYGGPSVLLCTSDTSSDNLLFCVMLSLAITSSTYLFAALIAVDGTSCDSGPLGDGKSNLT